MEETVQEQLESLIKVLRFFKYYVLANLVADICVYLQKNNICYQKDLLRGE